MKPNDELLSRLRRLGQQPLRPATAASHVELMRSSTQPRRSPHVLPAFAAVLVLALVAVPAIILAGRPAAQSVVRFTSQPPPPSAVGATGPAQEPTDSPPSPVPFAEDPCKGPPPFAGTPPQGATEAERETNRAAEAQAFQEQRNHCPNDEDTTGPPRGVPPSSSMPFAEDPCKGPPPFAGTPPEGATEAERETNRAAEAQAFEEQRNNCPNDDDEKDRRQRHAGPPSGRP